MGADEARVAAETAASTAEDHRAHVDSIRDTLDEAAQSNVAPYLTQTALNATYQPRGDYALVDDVAGLTADKLDKAEAADIYATPSQVAGIVDPLVPPLVADALAADDAPAQAAAVAVDAYIAAQGRATETADGLMPATDKKLLGSLVDTSPNLIDLGVLQRGWILTPGSGTPSQEFPNFGLTPHIPLPAGTVFTMKDVLRATYFDAAGVYVGFYSGTNQVYKPAGETRTAPPNTATVRFSVQNTREATAQVNLGPTILPYEPGHPPRLGEDFMPEVSVELSAQSDNLLLEAPDGLLLPTITPEATNFFEKSTNLINPDTVTRGVGYVSPGATKPTPYANRVVTDYIPLGAGQQFTVANAKGEIPRVTYFNAAKEWIGDFTYGARPTTRTTPAGCAFIRFSVVESQLGSAQANLGPAVLDFEPGHSGRIKDAYLPKESVRRRPVLDTDVSHPYETHVTQPDLNAAINATTVASVYQMWDDLVTAHPGYVTRTHLGDVTHGTDTWPMYRYDLKPAPIPGVGGHPPGYPAPLHRMLLVTGSHGGERTPVWTMHRLAQAMCEDWDTNPAMEALRFNTHLTVVPIANPSGWTDGTRMNRNGVDLIRNFPTDWIEGKQGSIRWGGPAPMSETETQLLMPVLKKVKDEAVAVIDFHSFLGIAGQQEEFMWHPPATDATLKINVAHIRRMERIWKKSQTGFSADPQVQKAGAVGAIAPGNVAYEAAAMGVPVAGIFEHSERVWTDGVAGPVRTSQPATMGFEAWANYLLMILENWHKG